MFDGPWFVLTGEGAQSTTLGASPVPSLPFTRRDRGLTGPRTPLGPGAPQQTSKQELVRRGARLPAWLRAPRVEVAEAVAVHTRRTASCPVRSLSGWWRRRRAGR